MLLTVLLVVCSAFSCLALVASLWSLHRWRENSQMVKSWKRVEDSYNLAAKTFQDNYVRLDGDLDRLTDRFELHVKAFTRFRSRVTMAERRAEEDTPPNPKPANEVPLTEEQKDAVRLALHNRPVQLVPSAAVPRDIEED